jgi:hypothetical protein
MILLENRCPAYITQQRFWANQERLPSARQLVRDWRWNTQDRKNVFAA